MHIASDGIKTAIIYRSDDIKFDWSSECSGFLPLWGKHKNLGDEHDSPYQRTFLTDQAVNYVTCPDLFSFIQRGLVKNLRLAQEDNLYVIQAYSPPHGFRDTGWKLDEELNLVSSSPTLSLVDDLYLYFTDPELLQLIQESPEVVTLPVYQKGEKGLRTCSELPSESTKLSHTSDTPAAPIGYISIDKQTAQEELTIESEYISILRLLPEDEQIRITLPTDKGKTARDLSNTLKVYGFTHLNHEEHIRNLYDNMLSPIPSKPLVDCMAIRLGAVFKRKNELYMFDQWNSDGSFTIHSFATYKPERIPLPDQIWKRTAEEHLRSEVQHYHNVLTDNIFCYQYYEGFRSLDGSSHYDPGDKTDFEMITRDMLGLDRAQALQGRFITSNESPSDFDIHRFLSEQDFPKLRTAITRQVIQHICDLLTKESPFPYGTSGDEILCNKDKIMDRIVQQLYDKHEELSLPAIVSVVKSEAGVNRQLLPRLSREDLAPGQDYTAEELMSILNQKSTLDNMIAKSSQEKHAQQSDAGGYKQPDHGR